jgi:hypothetical protein
MLSRWALQTARLVPKVAILWRFPANADITRVPNYEGQALNLSLAEQLVAAGVETANFIPYVPQLACGADFDLLLVMNNFNDTQQEAPNQDFSLPTSQFAPLAQAVTSGRGKCPVAFADVHYSNGADSPFCSWLNALGAQGAVPSQQMAYAGWNTAGNTLGTAVANGLLLLLPDASPAAASAFTLLRFLEDNTYQALVRQELVNYVEAAGGDTSDLTPHLDFYEEFVALPVQKACADLNEAYISDISIDQVYFPWNRTFEIGFEWSYID